jgi:hypothetical protein
MKYSKSVLIAVAIMSFSSTSVFAMEPIVENSIKFISKSKHIGKISNRLFQKDEFSLLNSFNIKSKKMNNQNLSLYPHNQKRFFRTKLRTEGYEPKDIPPVYNVNILTLPKKLEYLDDSYEVFRSPPGFQEMLDESVKHSHKDFPYHIKEETLKEEKKK